MCMHTHRVVWIALSILSTTSFAQANEHHRSSTLSYRQDIIRFALKNNRALQVFETQIQQADARRKGTKIFPTNPVLSGGGGTQTPASGTTSLLPRVEANLSWAFPIGGRWNKAQTLATQRLTWMKQQRTWRRLQLSLNVHLMLNRIAINWHIRQKRQAMVSFFQTLERYTKQRLQHGDAIQLDLQLAQNARLQAEQAALLATLRHKQLRQTLKQLIGWDATKPLTWNIRQIPTPQKLPPLKTLLQRINKRHPLLMLAHSTIVQAKASLGLSKSRAIPDLTVSLGYALEDNNHVFRGGLSIPLPLFWRNQGNIGQAHARIRQATLSLKRQQFILQQQLKQSYMRYSMNKRMNRLFQKRLQTTKSNEKLLKGGIKQGGISIMKLLTTQKSILQNHLQSLKNMQKTHDNYIKLHQATGTLPRYKSTQKNKPEGEQ
ncbi:MAG: hypothetical protein CL920_24015 [Deltaproteobacteria bacterium]|nr:hypothetical protein [Deltaproteobacteria bacterium]